MGVEAELGIERLESLWADPALVAANYRECRVARHHARQQEVERERHPQGQHEESQAAQHESHVLLLMLT